MNGLDIRTIFFCALLTGIICTGVIAILWRQNHERFNGIGLLVLGYAMQTLGLLLMTLRGTLPEWASILIASALIVTGTLFIYKSLERFTALNGMQIHNVILVLFFIGTTVYFTYLKPDLTARIIGVSLIMLILWVQCAWLLLVRVTPHQRTWTRAVGLVFSGFCLLTVIRFIKYAVFGGDEYDFFQTRIFDALIIISYLMLFILQTFLLTLVVNKRLLIEVETAEEKFFRAFYLSPYAAALVSMEKGRITEANKKFLETIDYKEEEVIGKTVMDLHLWERQEDRLAVFHELSEMGGISGREYKFRKKTGEILTGVFSAAIISTEGEKYVLSTIDDVTQTKRMREDLQQSEKFLQSIIEQSPYPMWIADNGGTLIQINQACLKTFNLVKEEVLGKYNILQDNIVAEQGFMPLVKEVLEKGSTARFDLHYDTSRLKSLQLQKRSILVVDTTIFPVKDQHGNITNAVIQFIDITVRRQMEEANKLLHTELQQKVEDRTRALHDTQLALLNLVDDLEQTAKNLSDSNTQLSSANKELTAFSYSVSHDLRAPLRSMEGFSQALLEDYSDKLDDHGQDYLKRICNGAKKMNGLISDLLKLARVNQADIILQEVNLSAIAEEIIREKRMNDSGGNRIVTIRDNIIVKGDSNLLKIALTNLLDNAWKFTSLSAQPQIELGVKNEAGQRVFFVRDNGVGFDMEQSGRLFGVFQRMHNDDEFPGTGIGLATVQRIIHRSGGQIWAEAEVGRGATFFFTLPV
jgi:PAS domain S-box-containing protein